MQWTSPQTWLTVPVWSNRNVAPHLHPPLMWVDTREVAKTRDPPDMGKALDRVYIDELATIGDGPRSG
jgi:hypothetical protein